MPRRVSKLPMAILLTIPYPALAADFGKVRWPDWMDGYIFPLMPTVGVLMLLTIFLKPRGVPVNEMYLNFRRFGPLGKLVYVCFGLTFVVLMGLIFLGMGLQRAAEAGL